MLATQLNTLPIIDQDLQRKLLGDTKDTIPDILDLLIDSLPHDVAAIKAALETKSHEQMLALVHRLHGAVCYSPTPRLKLVLSLLETQLRNNIIDELPSLLELLEKETKEVIRARNKLI